jgi:hypothetical protein
MVQSALREEPNRVSRPKATGYLKEVLTVYLDQKDWIGLAKAIYSAKATDPQRVVARNLKALADSGVVRFPVSDTHLMEASKIRNQQRRLQLASVFARFAQGWFLASRQARLAFEIEHAIATLLEIAPCRATFEPVARNFFWAFGEGSFLAELLSIGEERLQRISNAMEPETLLRDYLAFDDEHLRTVAVERLTKGREELAARIEVRRVRMRQESEDMRVRVYSALLFSESQEKLQVGLRALGRTFSELLALPNDRVAAVIDLIPCFDVERGLAIRGERDGPRNSNDIFDIAALTGAIPYCDIVLADNFWVHICRVSGIAAKYQTAILSSLEELEAELTGRYGLPEGLSGVE